jgi:hypothetical protein
MPHHLSDVDQLSPPSLLPKLWHRRNSAVLDLGRPGHHLLLSWCIGLLRIGEIKREEVAYTASVPPCVLPSVLSYSVL